MIRTPSPPTGVGICLSGGGLRSASYALGVLQVLQERRGLLLGPDAARYLSVVSGGSYVAAAVLSNARAISQGSAPAQPAPMALGSPEEQHVLDHGRYLVEPLPRRLLTVAGLSLLNVASVLALFGFTGLLLTFIAMVGQLVGWQLVDSLPWWTSMAAVGVALVVTVRGLFVGSAARRAIEVLAGFVGRHRRRGVPGCRAARPARSTRVAGRSHQRHPGARGPGGDAGARRRRHRVVVRHGAPRRRR